MLKIKKQWRWRWQQKTKHFNTWNFHAIIYTSYNI